ncbi:MAG: Smr/MutS family protein [Holosporales bacterium]|jgi:DNA-nicking Smr family endonuclease|nr:Smr/MutS family protein [Holosporales bacterium]
MASTKDIDLWHEYAKSVEKLKNKDKVATHQEYRPFVRKENYKSVAEQRYIALKEAPYEKASRSTLRVVKLTKSERRNFSEEAVIDLHGFSRDVATNLTNFCLKCIERKVKNVVMISGKGEGVLKNAVLEWLIANPELVVGFFEIKDAVGGSGAFGVRLRSRLNMSYFP